MLRQSNISEIMQAALKLLMKFQVKTITNLSLFNTFDLNDFYSSKQQPLALFILIDPADLATLPYAS